MKRKMSDIEAQIERTKQQVAAMSDALQKAQASASVLKVQVGSGAGGGGSGAGGGGSATSASPLIVAAAPTMMQVIPPEDHVFEWDSLMRDAMKAWQHKHFEEARFFLDFAREVRLMDLQHAEKFEEIRKELKEE